MLRQLFWDVILVVSFQIIVGSVVFDYFHVHVRHAQSKNVIFVFWISDFGYRVVQNIVANLMVKVIVGVFVELIEFGKFWNLKNEFC